MFSWYLRKGIPLEQLEGLDTLHALFYQASMELEFEAIERENKELENLRR